MGGGWGEMGRGEELVLVAFFYLVYCMFLVYSFLR